jgi:hypothetical protein
MSDVKEALLKEYEEVTKDLEHAVNEYLEKQAVADLAEYAAIELKAKKASLYKACHGLGIELPEDIEAKQKLAEDTKATLDKVETVVAGTKSKLVNLAKFGSKVLDNVTATVNKKVDELSKTTETETEVTVEDVLADADLEEFKELEKADLTDVDSEDLLDESTK